MIFLIGSEGKIGVNLAQEFQERGIRFTAVTRTGNDKSLSFKSFLNNFSIYSNAIIVNVATLTLSDLSAMIERIRGSARFIHISSVSVYGNTRFENTLNPINKYGNRKLLEEELVKGNGKYLIIRLSNVFGGNPETSNAISLFNNKTLGYIEVDESGEELIRDYVAISELTYFIADNLNFRQNLITNISSGIGLNLTQFFDQKKIDISHLPRVECKGDVIRESVVDSNYSKSDVS